MGLALSAERWCPLREVLCTSQFRGVRQDEIETVVGESLSHGRPRFELWELDGELCIRATSKHTCLESQRTERQMTANRFQANHCQRESSWQQEEHQEVRSSARGTSSAASFDSGSQRRLGWCGERVVHNVHHPGERR